MKAVYYHADSHFAWGDKPPAGFYKALAESFKAQCHAHGIGVIHLTCAGHEGWGDETQAFNLDPHNIVANREEAFTAFLKDAPDDLYWFVEPDFSILQMFPKPSADLTLLYRRGDDVPVSPAFRLATKKALPIFEEARDLIRQDHRKDWHGDSATWTAVWERMGKPTDKTTYLGARVEFWPFADFVKPGLYTINPKGRTKLGAG